MLRADVVERNLGHLRLAHYVLHNAVWRSDISQNSMFGDLPAYGFFIRHVKGLQMRDVELSYLKPDMRPPFWLNDVNGVSFVNLRVQRESQAPSFVFKNISDFSILQSWPLPDQRLERVAAGKL